MNKLYKFSMITIFSYGIFIIFSSNSGGSPGGYTGSPLDGKTCGTNGGCHNTQPNERAIIATNITEEGFESGKTYEITISPQEEGINKYGFEFMAVNQSNQAVGSVTANSSIMLRGNGLRATHNAQNNSGVGGRSWTFDWTAPENISEAITFYVASMAANNDGGTGGDRLLVSNLTVNAKLASADKVISEAIKVYPSPASDYIMIPQVLQNAVITIISLQGQQYYLAEKDGKINLSHLTSGVYIIQILEGASVKRGTFLKL